MTAPRLAPTLALDFPNVPDDVSTTADAPSAAPRPRQPAVWTRSACTWTHPCAECQAAAARIVARVVGGFAPGSLADLNRRRP